jgi:CspA family cold shock protein
VRPEVLFRSPAPVPGFLGDDMLDSTATKTGRVKFYSDAKGYGFIIQDDGGPEYFFHISQVSEACEEPVKGSRVSFTEGNGRDGRPCAQNVVVAE